RGAGRVAPGRATAATHVLDPPLIALARALEPRLEAIGLRGGAFGIDAQHRFLNRLPAAVVQNDCEHRQPIGLRDGIDRVRRRKMESAVADDLHYASPRSRQLDAEPGSARKAEPAAREAHIGLRLRALDLPEHRARIADRLIDDDVVLRELSV